MWGRCWAALAAIAVVCGLVTGSASAATRYIRGDSLLAAGACTDPANPCMAAYVLNGPTPAAQDGDTVVAPRSFAPFNVASQISIQKAITLRGEDGARPSFYGSLGTTIFSLGVPGVHLSHLRVQNSNTSSGAVSTSASAMIDDAVIDGAGYSLSAGTGSLTMTDTLLRCGATAFSCVSVNAGANPVTLSRVHIDDSVAPPNNGGAGQVVGTDVLVEDSTFSATASGLTVLASTAGTMRRVTATAGNTALTVVGPMVVTDSVLVSTVSGAGVTTAGSQTLQLRNVTAIGRGSQAYGVTAGGGQNVFGAITPAPAIVARNVIARGDTADLNAAAGVCFSPPCVVPPPNGSLTIDHSNFRTTAGTGTIAGGAGNQSGDPKFAGADDFHLLAGSPAIEAGLADPLDGPTDLDGHPRVAGAAPDIGAYEGTPPAAPPTPAPTDKTPPTLAAVKIYEKGALIRFNVSEAGKATVTINQLLRGRKSGKRCVKSTPKLRRAKRCTRHVKVRSKVISVTAGANFIEGKALKPGTYEVVLTAVDAAGNKATKTTKLVVRRAAKKR